MGDCSVIVKATRLCNLRCTYCNDWRAGPGHTMSFAVLARMTAAALRDPAHDRVSFIWHGGEPTVLPLRWFERALALQARFARPDQQVRNVIQTNGSRITAEWARFLADNEFSVGVSIDGPAPLHDRHRSYVSGRGSFADAVSGVRTLREHGVAVGVLLVVDDETLALGPDACFDLMVDNGITSFGLNAVVPPNAPEAAPGTPATPYVAPDRMTEFLRRLFDRWIEYGADRVRIRELDALLARVAGEPAAACQFRGGCLGEFFIVEPDGEVAHCDLFLGDPAYRLGNVLTDSFAQLRAGTAMRALSQTRAQELREMAACPEFAVCNGWCPHETYLSRRHDPRYRRECCGLRDFIGYLRDHADPVVASAGRRPVLPLAVAPVSTGS